MRTYFGIIYMMYYNIPNGPKKQVSFSHLSQRSLHPCQESGWQYSSPFSSPTGRGRQPLYQPSCPRQCHLPNVPPRCAEPRSQASEKCLCRSSSCVHGAWSPCAACVSWLRAVLSQTSQGCLPRPHCKACVCRPSPLLKTACADEHSRRRHPKTTCVL